MAILPVKMWSEMESLPCSLMLPFTQQDGLYQTGYPILSNKLKWDQAQNLGSCSSLKVIRSLLPAMVFGMVQ